MKRKPARGRKSPPKKKAGRRKAVALRHPQKVSLSVKKFNFLKDKLIEAQETLDAIRAGVVDAVVVAGPHGNRVYSLAGAEQPYRVYVEQMQEGAVTVSSEAMILYCNQTFASMLKVPLERVISSDLSKYLEPGSWGKIFSVFSGEGRVAKYESLLYRPDGTTLPIHLTASRLPMQGQEVMCLVVSDSTEQKEKVELRLAKEVAEKASLAKDAFLAALSHELRTPLNPVLLLASEGAANREWPENVRADFASIRDNAELEARLIDDLLDLTRIANGKLTMEVKTLEPEIVLQQAIKTVRPELDQKRLSLTLALGAEDYCVNGDAIRLQQVFWNILRNAIKFTPERGAITVTSRVENGRFSAIVSDTGIGMTSDELKRVFERFAQGEHASHGSHHFGGLGLGLAISRKLVELHAGTIHAFSDGPNLGATFIVRLPLVARSETAARDESRVITSEVSIPLGDAATRILLVEDHEPTRLTLARLLTRRNYHVTSASCVTEALALAKENQFNLVISDIGLPDGNGFDLMKELSSTQQVKGIALTGFGMEQDIERSRASGFAAHLTKPVRVQSLEAALARLSF